MKQQIVIAVAIAFGLAGCQSVLKAEPPKGGLKTGQRVLVDDGSCPAGQVKQVTGGSPNTPRLKECVQMPHR